MIEAREIAATPFSIVKNNEEMVLSLLYYARGMTGKVHICEKSLFNYYKKLGTMLNEKSFNDKKYLLRKGLLYIRKTGEHVSREGLSDEKAASYLQKKLLKPSDFERMPEQKSEEPITDVEGKDEAQKPRPKVKKVTRKKKAKN